MYNSSINERGGYDIAGDGFSIGGVAEQMVLDLQDLAIKVQ